MTKKNMFRVAAVLMVCVMILSSFSFAAGMGYGCTAGTMSSSAYTSYGGAPCSVSLSVYYEKLDDPEGRVETGSSDSSYSYASTSCSYPRAIQIDAFASHTAANMIAYSEDHVQ